MDAGESDENEFIPNEMDRNKSPNPKKPGIKHFMSPTESAKSKVVAKRVLGERIESLASCDGANVVPPKPHRGGRYSACSYNSKSDDDEDVLSTVSWDASLKPYDPRTNYESPRPKFLRYKPKKRHGILSVPLNSQNQEFIEGDKGSESDQEPQECSSESPGVEAEKDDDHEAEYTDNEEDEEEEGEELEEVKGGSLKWVVKFLLLLAAVTLSTSYIATMNDPTPSPVVDAVGVLRDGFQHMHRYLSEAVFPTVDNNVAWVNGSSGLHTSDVQAVFLGRNSGVVHITEPSDDGEMQDDSDWSDSDIAEEQEADGDKETDPFPEFEIAESDVANDQEPVAMDAVVQISSEIRDDCQISDGDKDTDRFSELEITESTMANDQESDAMDVVVQLPSGIFSESDQLENDHHSSGDEKPLEMAVEAIAMESDEPVEATDATTVASDEPGEVADTTASMANEEPEEDADTFIVESEIQKGDSELQATEGGFNPVEVMKSMRLSSWLYILFTTVMASLACIYFSSSPKQAPAPELHEVAERKEELVSKRPLVEFQHKPEKAVEETAKEQQQHAKTHAAPIVELLAELDIQEHSSSLRSCGGQKGKVKTEESVHFHAESRTPPVGQVPSVNASNSGESSSLGSFTAEKSVLRKQARKEKVEKVVPTPVRRSSRIRNLSIASP